MRAMVVPQFGGPEVFELKDIPRPAPGPGEVLVRVVCSGVNPVDAKLRRDGRWAQLEPPVVLGHDVSGVVEAAGPGETQFRPGDEVYYTPELFNNPLGSDAEYNVVPESIIAPKPRSLTHEQAAAVPLAGGTAWEGVVRRLQIKPGETILIHGGAGGVGSFAVQIAKAYGARVFATASAKNQSTLKKLGADVAMDYARDNAAEICRRETGGAGVDAVFDTVGGTLIGDSVPAVRAFGRMACILPPGGDLTRLYVKNLTIHAIFLTREGKRLREIARLIDDGRVRPLIDQVLPLEDVRRAHERLDTGHGTGKIVLRVN
jgi:NADPH:quinone reductase